MQHSALAGLSVSIVSPPPKGVYVPGKAGMAEHWRGAEPGLVLSECGGSEWRAGREKAFPSLLGTFRRSSVLDKGDIPAGLNCAIWWQMWIHTADSG